MEKFTEKDYYYSLSGFGDWFLKYKNEVEKTVGKTMNKTPVLDHGFVRLIDSMGSDLSVVRSARISYDAAWRAGEDAGSDKRLINYLMKNGHNTPFESVTMTFEIKAPIFVFRQLMRHRTFSYNEISARYKELPAEYYIPEQHEIGVQSSDNKQMREFINNDNAGLITALIEDSCTDAFVVYDDLIKLGAPRELARTVLPLATYSHIFMTGNLHNYFKFLGERLHEHAQWEIQQYAKAMLQHVQTVAPECTNAFLAKLEQ